MSVKLMSLVWDSGITDVHELSVLLVLADFANDDGFCYPSQTKIAMKARVSREFANRTIKKYVSDDTIEKTTHNNKMAYIFHADKLPKKDEKPASKPASKNVEGCDSESQGNNEGVIPGHRGCDSQSQGGVTDSHRGCDSQSQPSEPSMNRQDEPSMNTHTGADVADKGKGVCVSNKEIWQRNGFWKSEHPGTTISSYAKAHGLGNGWITEAIKTALYDEMIQQWLCSPKDETITDKIADSPLLTLKEAIQRVSSMSEILLPEHLPRFIDELAVTDEDRECLRDKFLMKSMPS